MIKLSLFHKVYHLIISFTQTNIFIVNFWQVLLGADDASYHEHP